jgi:hypothetical protein
VPGMCTTPELLKRRCSRAATPNPSLLTLLKHFATYTLKRRDRHDLFDLVIGGRGSKDGS